jgi:hypothetical protein
MSMAATKISRFFIIFTALLIDKIAGYKAKETRTTTGRFNQAGAHQRPRQLPIKGAHEIG